MNRFLTIWISGVFVTASLWSPLWRPEAHAQDEEEPDWEVTRPSYQRLLGTPAEGLGAFLGGLAGGAGTWLLTYWVLQDATGLPSLDEARYFHPAEVGLAAGYCVGLPLGSAIGTSAFGKATSQSGSVWWSWVGANLGTISALLFTGALGESPLGMFVPGVLVAGPVVGAVVGYNCSKGVRDQQDPLQGSSNADRPRFSYLQPEVEVGRDRLSHSRQLTYKLTMARLNF